MNVPNVPANISTSVNNIVTDLYQSEFADSNVDLQIDVIGALNYKTGYKLRMTFVDSFEDNDVAEWREIARKNGASDIKTRVNTSSGYIDINIEYKSGSTTKISRVWILRAMSILVASWSYQQLHLLNQGRYPLPIALSA